MLRGRGRRGRPRDNSQPPPMFDPHAFIEAIGTAVTITSLSCFFPFVNENIYRDITKNSLFFKETYNHNNIITRNYPIKYSLKNK